MASFSYFTDEKIKVQREGACPESQLTYTSSLTGRESLLEDVCLKL